MYTVLTATVKITPVFPSGGEKYNNDEVGIEVTHFEPVGTATAVECVAERGVLIPIVPTSVNALLSESTHNAEHVGQGG